MINLNETILTLDEYMEATGTDLNVELSSKFAVVSGEAGNIFIKQIEDVLRLKYMHTWNGELTSENQTNWFKLAAVYQIMYELQSGSLWNDSGYSMTQGVVIDTYTLQKIVIAPMAHSCMRKGGMANLPRGE